MDATRHRIHVMALSLSMVVAHEKIGTSVHDIQKIVHADYGAVQFHGLISVDGSYQKFRRIRHEEWFQKLLFGYCSSTGLFINIRVFRIGTSFKCLMELLELPESGSNWNVK